MAQNNNVNNKNTLIICAILVGAFLLRLYGIWHDYPYSFYPDEAHFVKRALSFGSMDFNPHWFHKPAFYMYLLFFEYGLFFVAGKIIGLWSSVTDFAVSYVINPGPFYIIGRITTTLFGIASIWMVYLIGEKFFKKNTGLAGALLLTLSYAHVISCQDIKADIPASFFAIASMYFLLNYARANSTKWLVLSASCAGIGAGTKIYPIIMMVPITLAIVLAANDTISLKRTLMRKFLLIMAAVAVFWLSYFCSAPYSFIDPLGRVEVFEDFVRLFHKVVNIMTGSKIPAPRPDDFIAQPLSTLKGTIAYFLVLFQSKGMGPIVTSFSLLGIVALLAKINKKTFLFLLFPVVFVVTSIFTFPGYAEPRHQMPIYPFLALTGGSFIIYLTGIKSIPSKIVFIVVGLCLSWPLIKIIDYGAVASKTDTRNLAKQWIEKNIASGTKVLVNENGPQLIANKKSLTPILSKAEQADKKGQFTAHYDSYLEYRLLAADITTSYEINEIRLPWWRQSFTEKGEHEFTSDYDKDMGNPLKSVGINTYKFYVENNFKYAIVHSYEYQDFLKDKSRKSASFPAFAEFYHNLFAKGKLIKEFLPTEGNRPGPVVKIFQFQPS